MSPSSAGDAKPLSGSRFDLPPAEDAWRLVRSISFDVRLAPYDVRVSKAHAAALAAAGILSRDERDRLREALDAVGREIAEETFHFAERDEDIHMAIERALTERLGETGEKLHAGRSRNDQVAADLRLFVKDASAEVGAGVRALVGALVEKAEAHRDHLMPGFTHLQRAQPILLSHHLLAHAWAFVRDESRLVRAAETADSSPLGAAALAGSTLPLGSDTIASELGFARLAENSVDAVAARDFALEFLAAGAIVGLHLSRLAEEVILWSTTEFGFVRLDDGYATGSSIMPQKRNPDPAELVRAKAGRLVGNFSALATTLKGLPLAYNRDLQEDKEPVFDTADTLLLALKALEGTVRTMRFDVERLSAAATDPTLLATDIAEHLTIKGMPFREAHGLVGRIVAEMETAGRTLADLSPSEWAERSELLRDLPSLDPQRAVASRESPGATSPSSVESQLRALRTWLTGP